MLDVKLVRKRQTNYPEVFKAINRNFLPKAGVIVLADAQRFVPVAEVNGGRLKGSLKYKVHGTENVTVGTNVEYAPYVEYGTGRQAEGGKGKSSISGMPAQPYLRPALDMNRKNLVKLWAVTYNKVFKLLGGRG